MYNIYKVVNFNFMEFHLPPLAQNAKDYFYPFDPLKFRFIFVKMGAILSIMITWSHFYFLNYMNKV